ncbi:MAG TPA: hypothetical protein VFQ61_31845 [Polyangiaceae bacterium]|nr:hypothetical protein [Polyangiaceae bacterium]
MSFPLQHVEIVGLVFWVMSLLFLARARQALIITCHLLCAALSFAFPVLAALRADHLSLTTLVQIWVLGLLNGLMGSAWCARLDPPIPKAPMLGITAAGLGAALLIVFMIATPTRLF